MRVLVRCRCNQKMLIGVCMHSRTACVDLPLLVLAIECMTGLDEELVIDKQFTGNGGCHMGVQAV